MQAGHGPNIGHGYVKYVLIDDTGERELIMPAQIAPAQRAVAGALFTAQAIPMLSSAYWVGDDAQLAGDQRERLSATGSRPTSAPGAYSERPVT